MSNHPKFLIEDLLEGLPEAGGLCLHLYRGRLSPGPAWRITRTMETCILYIILGGRGQFRCGETELPIQAPSALLLARGLSYSLASDPSRPLVFHPIHFKVTSRENQEVPNSSRAQPWQILDTAGAPDLIGLLETLGTLWRSGRPAGQQAAAALLHALLEQLAAPLLRPKGNKPPPHPGILEVCAFIDRHPGHRLPLTELARKAGMSRSGFCQRFKEMTGLSPGQYAIRQRCHYAAGLIREEGFRVAEAAAATGYADSFTFSKQFRAVMGYPPSAAGRF
ncbi:MAG: helix-turn-helix transcriptional regulator [Verrucomicrobia bacterium]|nr:helix-turn-helix transcriptional regulator [Verrucomicrobiota bacterium]MCH8527843.1 AraC family transcriptional regulator [Kiritimatiellia bacterium]